MYLFLKDFNSAIAFIVKFCPFAHNSDAVRAFQIQWTRFSTIKSSTLTFGDTLRMTVFFGANWNYLSTKTPLVTKLLASNQKDLNGRRHLYRKLARTVVRLPLPRLPLHCTLTLHFRRFHCPPFEQLFLPRSSVHSVAPAMKLRQSALDRAVLPKSRIAVFN